MRSICRSLALLAILPAAVASELPQAFIDAQPRVQLYMAYAQFKMADHATARAMWEHIGGAGKAEAAFNLGILYEQGLGVTVDLSRAAAYYRSAAEEGSRAGAYQLGLMHLAHGDRVTADEARHWLSVAALDGDADAAALLQQLVTPEQSLDPLTGVRLQLAGGDTEQALDTLRALTEREPPPARALTLLAWLYERGMGVEADIDRAGVLFRRAAELGDAEAQYALAVMLETGVGQSQDGTEARYWLQRAAAQGYQSAVDALGEN